MILLLIKKTATKGGTILIITSPKLDINCKNFYSLCNYYESSIFLSKKHRPVLKFWIHNLFSDNTLHKIKIGQHITQSCVLRLY